MIVCTYLHPEVIEKHLRLIHPPAVHQQPLLCLPDEGEICLTFLPVPFLNCRGCNYFIQPRVCPQESLAGEFGWYKHCSTRACKPLGPCAALKAQGELQPRGSGFTPSPPAVPAVLHHHPLEHGKQNRSYFPIGLTSVGVGERAAESRQGLGGGVLFSRCSECRRKVRGDRRRQAGEGAEPLVP